MRNKLELIKEKRNKKTHRKMRNFILSSIIGISVITVITLMGFNYKVTFDNSKNDLIELSKNSTEKDAQNINGFFSQHREVLLTSAKSLEFYLSSGPYEGEKIEELLKDISISYDNSAYSDISDISFTGIYAAVDGVLYHGLYDRSVLPADYDPTERQWYKEALLGNGEAVFGDLYEDIYNPGVMVMTVSKVLEDGSSVVGMDITLNDLIQSAGKMDISVNVNGHNREFGFGFVISDKGKILVTGDNNLEPSDSYNIDDYSDVNHPLHGVYEKILEYGEWDNDKIGHYHVIKVNGKDCFLFSSKLINGCYYATLTDTQSMNSTSIESSRLLLIGTIAIVGIALLYCSFISMAYIRSQRMSDELEDVLALATTDALTGDSNRTAYDIKLRELESRLNTPEDRPFVLVMMDLNDLKYINDKESHNVGDQYIKNSCAIMKSVVPTELYRIGGDEFVMIIDGDLFPNWKNYYDELKARFEDSNLALIPSVDSPSVSIGLALHLVGQKETMEDLIREADIEMYTNKTSIKQNRFERSEEGNAPDLKLKVLDKQLLASEMKIGLEEKQFEVWFQPQVNHVNQGAVVGAEALVRWRHPTRGMVSPAIFIPLFEYNGLIYELDKYVWRQTCKFLFDWAIEGHELIPISINVSRLDILQPDFYDTILSIVNEYDIPHHLVHLELTESAFTDNLIKITEILYSLKEAGFIIAIDDFGSGYSSLSILRNVPAQVVKLDMRFFSDGDNQTRNECIIESIIRMVKMLGMSVLAEGVESQEQADRLASIGCAYIQGYLYSKPLPPDEFIKYANNSTGEKLVINDTLRPETNIENDFADSKEMFHNIISGTNSAVIVVDNNSKQLLYANRTAENYYGKRFDPLTPTTCMSFCNNGKRCESCPAKDLKARERRELYTIDNGKHIKSLYTQMDWNGHDAFVLYQTDISAQMQEYEFSDSLMRNIPGATIAFELGKDDKPKIKFISDNAIETFRSAGITAKTPVFEDCQKIIHPDDLAKVREKANALFFEKVPFRSIFRISLANKKVMWIEALVNPVADRNGSYIFYAVYTDVTARKSAQDHLDNVLQSIPAAITIYEFTKDDANRIFISDRAKEVLRIDSKRHERRSIDSLFSRVHKEDVERVNKIIKDNTSNVKPFSTQFRILPEEGGMVWVQIDAQPIDNSNSKDTTLYYCIYTDISEQKQLEADAYTSVDSSFIESTISFGLQEATKQPTPDAVIEYIIGFVGKVLHGDRAYIFEKNSDHTDSNTYEWVKEGISPEIDNLQNLPEELSKPWYDEFKKQNIVVIEELEDIKESSPDLYNALAPQDIHSLVVAPLSDNNGVPMGFFGIDNPPKELLKYNVNLIQTISYYVEATLKRKNLRDNKVTKKNLN